jgi:hypothetical protein
MSTRELWVDGLSSTAAVAKGAVSSPPGAASSAYEAAARDTWRPVDMPPAGGSEAYREIIRYATLAPSGLNSQPWSFRLRADELLIHPDFTRRLPVADPDDEQLFVALGGAAENAHITARAFGMSGDLAYYPVGRGGMKLELRPAAHIEPSGLFHAIPRRQSAADAYDERAPSGRELEVLERAGGGLGVDILLVTDRPRIEKLVEVMRAAYAIQTLDLAFLTERRKWLRFNEREALHRRDGVYVRRRGGRALPPWLATPACDILTGVPAGSDEYVRRARSSGGFAVLAGAGRDPCDWVAVGRVCERFLLQATALNMRAAVVNEPIAARAARIELASCLGLQSRTPDVLIRFGYGPASTRSLRRPLERVML